MLPVNVRDPAVKRRCAWRPHPGSHSRPQALTNGLEYPPPPCICRARSKPLTCIILKKSSMTEESSWANPGVRHAHPLMRRDRDHAVNRPRPVFHIDGMPFFPQQIDLCIGIGGSQRMEGRLRKYKSPRALARSTAIFRTPSIQLGAWLMALFQHVQRRTCLPFHPEGLTHARPPSLFHSTRWKAFLKNMCPKA